MQCSQAKPLVPGYLDGELSESQAGALRQHLLECFGCRGSAQEAKVLSSWFVDDDQVAVPVGFAARVARRAFAGDTGLKPVAPAVHQESHLSFVQQLTGLAAAALIACTIGIRSLGMHDTGDLQADSTYDQALQALDMLNAEERDALEAARKKADAEEEQK